MNQPIIPDYDLQAYKDSLKSQAYYVSQIKGSLPKHIFKPVPQRLIWFFIHYAVIITCACFIVQSDSWVTGILLSIVMGHSMGVTWFLGHEMAHGCIVKNKTLIVILSSICFAHWGLYAKAWISWHNRKHHHATQHPYKDPDCYGKKYAKHAEMAKIEKFLPGSGSWLSYTYFFWVYSFYTYYVVWIQPRIFANTKEKVESRLFFILVYAAWITAAVLLHPLGIIYLFLIPLMMSNFVMMAYSATNHFINPLTEETNDPLVNSLTVDTNWFFNFLHLNFSYHVEHHLFPYMSPKYAPLVARVLKEKFPEKYHHMPHWKALKLYYQCPSFYHDDVTLLNLKTKERYPTIVLEDLI